MTGVVLLKIYEKKVWIESDFWGARHVMVLHDAPDEAPFTYCTFHYDYRHTSNSGTLAAAQAVARSLGATEPVELRHRGLAVQNEQPVDDRSTT